MRVVVRVFATRMAVRMRVFCSIGVDMLVFVSLVVVIVFGVAVPVFVRVLGSVGVRVLVGMFSRLHAPNVHRLCRALPHPPVGASRMTQWHTFGSLGRVMASGGVHGSPPS